MFGFAQLCRVLSRSADKMWLLQPPLVHPWLHLKMAGIAGATVAPVFEPFIRTGESVISMYVCSLERTSFGLLLSVP